MVCEKETKTSMDTSQKNIERTLVHKMTFNMVIILAMEKQNRLGI